MYSQSHRPKYWMESYCAFPMKGYRILHHWTGTCQRSHFPQILPVHGGEMAMRRGHCMFDYVSNYLKSKVCCYAQMGQSIQHYEIFLCCCVDWVEGKPWYLHHSLLLISVYELFSRLGNQYQHIDMKCLCGNLSHI